MINGFYVCGWRVRVLVLHRLVVGMFFFQEASRASSMHAYGIPWGIPILESTRHKYTPPYTCNSTCKNIHIHVQRWQPGLEYLPLPEPLFPSAASTSPEDGRDDPCFFRQNRCWRMVPATLRPSGGRSLSNACRELGGRAEHQVGSCVPVYSQSSGWLCLLTACLYTALARR